MHRRSLCLFLALAAVGCASSQETKTQPAERHSFVGLMHLDPAPPGFEAGVPVRIGYRAEAGSLQVQLATTDAWARETTVPARLRDGRLVAEQSLSVAPFAPSSCAPEPLTIEGLELEPVDEDGDSTPESLRASGWGHGEGEAPITFTLEFSGTKDVAPAVLREVWPVAAAPGDNLVLRFDEPTELAESVRVEAGGDAIAVRVVHELYPGEINFPTLVPEKPLPAGEPIHVVGLARDRAGNETPIDVTIPALGSTSDAADFSLESGGAGFAIGGNGRFASASELGLPSDGGDGIFVGNNLDRWRLAFDVDVPDTESPKLWLTLSGAAPADVSYDDVTIGLNVRVLGLGEESTIVLMPPVPFSDTAETRLDLGGITAGWLSPTSEVRAELARWRGKRITLILAGFSAPICGRRLEPHVPTATIVHALRVEP